MKMTVKRESTKGKRERGYTLLEYCAGAAVIAAVLWTSLNSLGGNIKGLLDAVGSWSTKRSAEVTKAG